MATLSPGDMGDAQQRTTAAMRDLTEIGENMADRSSAIRDLAASLPGPETFQLPPIPPNPNVKTAQHTEEMAEHLEMMLAYLGTMLDATNANLTLSVEAREEAKTAQASSRHISVASLVVSISATAAAFGSLIISIIALTR